MTRPYTNAQLMQYLKNIPIDLHEGIVNSILPDLLELLDEYYEAGYTEGYNDGKLVKEELR
jgi:hypothetical protein